MRPPSGQVASIGGTLVTPPVPDDTAAMTALLVAQIDLIDR